MPVIGIVKASRPDYCVENMEMEMEAHLYVGFATITKSKIFINIYAQVVVNEDDVADEYPDYIKIKRVGKGLTKDDFILSFSETDPSEVIVSPSNVELHLMKDGEEYIVFTEFEISIDNNKVSNTPKKSELEILESKLQDAINTDTTESYNTARELGEQIAELKKKNKLDKKEKDK